MLISMRHPTDGKLHPVHREIRLPVRYLPEYLHDEPWRVFKAFIRAQALAGYWGALPTFLQDLWREPDLHRLRRIGQALVLVTEIDPEIAWLHAHFIHTPASVTQYASLMTRPWLELFGPCQRHMDDARRRTPAQARRDGLGGYLHTGRLLKFALPGLRPAKSASVISRAGFEPFWSFSRLPVEARRQRPE